VTASTTSCALLFRRLFDDAAIFPPGNAPMPVAVADHRLHEKAWYATTVGPFVCSERRWPELLAALTTDADTPIDLALVVAGGLPSVADAVSSALAEPRVVLRAVEVAAGEAAAAVRVLDGLPQQVLGYVELAPGVDLDPLAGTRHRAKFRTGGDSAPDTTGLAQAIVAAVSQRVPFKLTGGLHHAVAADADQHGFLNVLVAVSQALAGASTDAVAGLLGGTDSARLVEHVHGMSAEQLTRVRAQFVSFGTCSISEPLNDLRTLGLVTP
jgi:hypothetical protein